MSATYNVMVFSFAVVGLILGIVAVTKIGKDNKAIKQLQTQIPNLQTQMTSNKKNLNSQITRFNTLDKDYEAEKDNLQDQITQGLANASLLGKEGPGVCAVTRGAPFQTNIPLPDDPTHMVNPIPFGNQDFRDLTGGGSWRPINKDTDKLGWYKIEATNFDHMDKGKTPTQSASNPGPIGYVWSNRGGADNPCNPGGYWNSAYWPSANPKCSFLQCPEGTTSVHDPDNAYNPRYLARLPGTAWYQKYPRPDSLPHCLCRPLDPTPSP